MLDAVCSAGAWLAGKVSEEGRTAAAAPPRLPGATSSLVDTAENL